MAILGHVIDICVFAWARSDGVGGSEPDGFGLAIANVLELRDMPERTAWLSLRIQVAAWSWVIVLGLNGPSFVDNWCLLPQGVAWRVYLTGLVVFVLNWGWKDEWIARDVVIEWHFLTMGELTSLLRPKDEPFFFDKFSSQNDFKLYLLEDGETVRHLVKSDFLPYPMAVPWLFLW